MSVKASAFFPGLAAYFNGNFPTYGDGKQWETDKLWRAFIVDKFATPFFYENKEKEKIRDEWVAAYITDGDKAAVKAAAMESIVGDFTDSKFDPLKREVERQKMIPMDDVVKENLDSANLDDLVDYIMKEAYPPISTSRNTKTSLAGVDWKERGNLRLDMANSTTVKEFLIDGVLAKNLARKASPRKSQDFLLNEKAMNLLHNIETTVEDAKGQKFDEKSREGKYVKFVEEVNQCQRKHEQNPNLRYADLPALVDAIARDPRICTYIKDIKDIEEKYGPVDKIDVSDESKLDISITEKKKVLDYRAIQNAVADYLVARAKNKNIPYADPTTQYYNFLKSSKEPWPIPTTLSVSGGRVQYLPDAIVGGIARLICAGINSLGKDPRNPKNPLKIIAKVLFAGPFMALECITYGVSKLTSLNSLWKEILTPIGKTIWKGLSAVGSWIGRGLSAIGRALGITSPAPDRNLHRAQSTGNLIDVKSTNQKSKQKRSRVYTFQSTTSAATSQMGHGGNPARVVPVNSPPVEAPKGHHKRVSSIFGSPTQALGGSDKSPSANPTSPTGNWTKALQPDTKDKPDVISPKSTTPKSPGST